jgi:ketosteroid isomerase-like protein
MTTSLKEIVAQVYRDFQAGDAPAIISRFHPQIDWEHSSLDHGIPWIVPGRGLEVVGRFFTEVAREFDFTHFEVLSLFEQGDQVVALLRIEANIRSTGKPIKDHEAHVFTFDAERKVIAYRHILDTHQHRWASRPG